MAIDKPNNLSLGGIADALGTSDGSDPNVAADDVSVGGKVHYDNLMGVPPDVLNRWKGTGTETMPAHGTQHKAGGSDAIASTAPAANMIPQADGTGKIDAGWVSGVAPAAHHDTHVTGSDKFTSADTLECNISGTAATATVAYYAP